MGPIPGSDGHDFPRLVDEAVLGVAAMVEDIVVVLEDPVAAEMARKFAQIAFSAGMLAVIALSLLPHETLPETGMWDKLNHALAYGVLAVLGGFGFKGWWSLLMVGIGLVVLGAGLELAQSVIPNRTGSIYDALANFVGVAIGSVATAGTNTFLRDQ